jgi:hypothetical protein
VVITMSAKHLTELRCDAPACSATFGPVIGPVQHARSLAAVQAGWARLRGPMGFLDDVCERCAGERRAAIVGEQIKRLTAAWEGR